MTDEPVEKEPPRTWVGMFGIDPTFPDHERDEIQRLREQLALLALADADAFPDSDVANYVARWLREEDYPIRAKGLRAVFDSTSPEDHN